MYRKKNIFNNYLFIFLFTKIIVRLKKLYNNKNYDFGLDLKKKQNNFLNVERRLHKRNLELYWTLIPAIILFIIGAPSLSVLYSISELVEPELTIKAIGNQWFWTYEYSIFLDNVTSLYWPEYFKSDFNRLEAVNIKTDADKAITSELSMLIYNTVRQPWKLIYESHMLLEDDLKLGELRLLEVDYWLLLPINVELRLLVSSVDVIHSFAVPSLGVKVDGVPGRTNEVPVFIKRKGIFYGQCSELCGVNHGFMPIVVQAMNKSAFIDIIADLRFGRSPVVSVLGDFGEWIPNVEKVSIKAQYAAAKKVLLKTHKVYI